MGYTEIRSPIDGVVASRAVYPGDIAPAGTPLLIVMDTSKVVVRLHIPQQQAQLLRLGQAAMLRVPGLDKDVPAKVTVLSPALDPNSTTEEIWVEADNRKGELKPGTTAQVSITAKTVANALVVPAAAILTGEGGTTSVMVVKADSRAYSQDVKTGIQQGPMIQVLSGLAGGGAGHCQRSIWIARQDKSEGHTGQRRPWQEGRGVDGDGGYSFELA